MRLGQNANGLGLHIEHSADSTGLIRLFWGGRSGVAVLGGGNGHPYRSL